MKIIIDNEYQKYSDFICDIPRMIDDGEGEVIYDKRNKIVRFSHDNNIFIAKKYKKVNFIQQIAYSFFCKTKAERAFEFAERYKQLGIDTPQRIAYMEKKSMGMFSIGYFVSSESKGTECHLLLREVKDYDKDLALLVAKHIVLMHSKGILHGDLNLSNFLYADGRLTMIDINRTQFCDGMPTDEECMNNLVRLTHRRDLYADILRMYARIRGWNEDETAAKALKLLDRFERKWL